MKAMAYIESMSETIKYPTFDYVDAELTIIEATKGVLSQNAAKQQPVPELHIHADRNLDYGKVADIMALSSRSGVSKIAFVSEPTGE
jgi:biopolymer transport protein ExbD